MLASIFSRSGNSTKGIEFGGIYQDFLSAKKRVICFVDCRTLFANFIPDNRSRPNEMFFVFMSNLDQNIKNCNSNSYICCTVDPVCTAIIIAREVIKRAICEDKLDEYFILSDSKLWAEFFPCFPRKKVLRSFCSKPGDFKKMLEFATTNGDAYQAPQVDVIIKEIGYTDSEVCLASATVLGESMDLVTRQSGFWFTVRTESGSKVYGPMTEDLQIKVTNAELLRRIKAWNGAQRQAGRTKVLITPVVADGEDEIELLENYNAGTSPEDALAELDKPWDHEIENVGYQEETKDLLRMLRRMPQADRDLLGHLVSLTRVGSSIRVDTITKQKIVEKGKMLIKMSKYGEIFDYSNPDYLKVRQPYDILLRYRWLADNEGHLLRIHPV